MSYTFQHSCPYHPGLQLRIRGKAVCHEEELYLNSTAYIFGSEKAKAQMIAPGFHSYGFSSHLPSNLPQSVEAKFASIRYKVVATLKFPMDNDYEAKKAFTVARCDDQNLMPCLLSPFIAQENVKRLFNHFSNSEPLIMKVSLPRMYFVSGEMIPIQVEFASGSCFKVPRIEVSLKQIERFVGDDDDRLETSTVLKVRTSGDDRCSLSTLHIRVPRDLPASNDLYCKIYQITYELKIKALLSAFDSLAIRMPIVIGSNHLHNS